MREGEYALVAFMYGDALLLGPDTVDDIEELASNFEIIGVADLCSRYRDTLDNRTD